MGLIFYLSSQSEPYRGTPAQDRAGQDLVSYVGHIAEFGILAFLLRWAFAMLRLGRWSYPVALLFTMLFAVGDEFHQSFTPGRTSSSSDVGLDAIGAFGGLAVSAAMGLIFFIPLLRWRNRRSGKGLPSVREAPL